MTDWAARATAHFHRTGSTLTDKTDESPISEVSSVGAERIAAKPPDVFVGFVSEPQGALSEGAVPADVEQRLVRLLREGAIDAEDAEMARRRFHVHPDEWLFLLDCCERAAQERTR